MAQLGHPALLDYTDSVQCSQNNFTAILEECLPYYHYENGKLVSLNTNLVSLCGRQKTGINVASCCLRHVF